MRVDDYIKRNGQSDADVVVLDDDQLRRLQLAELSIAQDVVTYCENNQICYTLGGGSVLGAVRHGGFIPWDDDIDINMPRESWERFYEGFIKEYSQKYELHSPETDSDCVINAIRIYIKGTCLRELSAPADKVNGIFIDIFIVENTPDNIVLRYAHGLLCSGLRYICSCRRISDQWRHYERIFKGNSAALRGFRFRSTIGKLFSFFKCQKWVYLSNAANGMCRNDCSKYLTIPTGQRRYFGEMIRRDDYLPPAEATFESHVWCIPKDSELYLTNLYGDWREIPPVEEREQHVLLELNFGDTSSTKKVVE